MLILIYFLQYGVNLYQLMQFFFVFTGKDDVLEYNQPTNKKDNMKVRHTQNRRREQEKSN